MFLSISYVINRSVIIKWHISGSIKEKIVSCLKLKKLFIANEMLLPFMVKFSVIIDTRSEHTIKGNSMVVIFQLRYT